MSKGEEGQLDAVVERMMKEPIVGLYFIDRDTADTDPRYTGWAGHIVNSFGLYVVVDVYDASLATLGGGFYVSCRRLVKISIVELWRLYETAEDFGGAYAAWMRDLDRRAEREAKANESI